MNIRELVKEKPTAIISVVGDTKVADAVALMANNNIGAVVIMGEENPQGIFTERDVLRHWKDKEQVQDKRIAEIMTRDIIVVRMDDPVDIALSVMIQENIRHVLVMEGRAVTALLSIRDLVKAKLGKLETKISYLDQVLSKDANADW